MERWAVGDFSDVSSDGSAQLSAKGVGQAEALKRVIELQFEQLYEDQDGQVKRNQLSTPGTDGPIPTKFALPEGYQRERLTPPGPGGAPASRRSDAEDEQDSSTRERGSSNARTGY